MRLLPILTKVLELSHAMADPVSAFGLAASILQFVDFGSKFAKNALNIYKAGSQGAAAEMQQLQSTTADLQSVLKTLQPPRNTSNSSTELEYDAGILKLAEECQQVATELLNSLNKINKIQRFEKPGKWDAIRTAFQVMWNEDNIKSLHIRMSEFRHQLTLHLLVSLR
jgi:hypothetical protein